MFRTLLCLAALMAVITGSLSTAHAQDWGNLFFYAAKNDSLSSQEARVVFMGDSITQGWSQTMPEFFTSNPYLDRGISGQVTAQMLVRFRADVLNLDPEAVVILAGTNDIAENQGPIGLEDIAGNIQSMAELAHAHGIRVIICSVLPAAEYSWRPGLGPDYKIPALNSLLKSYAESAGFDYLDYFSAMTDGENALIAEYTSDGVHVTLAGYDVMVTLVQDMLDTVLENE